jgi:hypothetical protein
MPIKYDKRRYRSRSRIEIMFGRMKDLGASHQRSPLRFTKTMELNTRRSSTGLAVALGKIRLKPRHLLVGQPIQGAHHQSPRRAGIRSRLSHQWVLTLV